LLRQAGIDHVCISRKGAGLPAMVKELLQRNIRLLRLAREFRPAVMVAAEAGVSIGPVGALLGVPRVVFEQVDRAPLQRLAGLPFATHICTGTGYPKDHGSRQVRFRGFLAQAYLDPRRFRPDPQALRNAGVDVDRPYIVMRLVNWSATHDIGREGWAPDELEHAVGQLSRHGRVVISAESGLPKSLQSCANPVPEANFHDLLAFAAACVAEGGTVAVEAGLLGTPAVCCNTYCFGYLRALESLGLIRRADSLQEALAIAESLLNTGGIRQQWRGRAEELFCRTDDVASFMYRLIQAVARQPHPRGRPRWELLP